MRTLLAACATATLLHAAAEWPNYRGPTNDQAAAGGLAWPAGGPKTVWKQPLGEGFGAFAIAGGGAFVLVEREGQEVCLRLDPATGAERWARPLGKTIFEKQGGNGPRSTPAARGGKVFTLGTYLALHALDAETGAVAWRKDLAAEHGGDKQLTGPGIRQWGSAASPIVVGDLVIVAGGGAGQTFLAFDATTGALRWKTGDDGITHATPTPATIHGVQQVIFLTRSGLVALDLAGAELWRQPFKFATSTAASPVVIGDLVYCSAGYGVGAGCYRLSKQGERFASAEVWRKADEGLVNHWSTPLAHEGHLYGMYGFKQYGSGPLKCIDAATGAEKWSQPGFGQGQIVRAGEHLLAISDRGELALAQATPTGWQQLGKAQVLSGKCWTMPAVADGLVYVRSVKDGICLDLRAR